MEVYAIISGKGGAGKTPTAVHLFYASGRTGKKALLIDLDPQGTASFHLLGRKYKSRETTVYNALKDIKRIEPIAIDENLFFLSAHDELSNAEIELTKKPGYIYQKQLKKLLTLYPEFEVVIIDTPGSHISIFTVMAATAATKAVVPVKTEIAAVEATQDTINLLEDVRGDLNPELIIWGILPTQFEGRVGHHKDALDILDDREHPLFIDLQEKPYAVPVYTEPSRKTTLYNDATGTHTDVKQLDPALGEYWDRVNASLSQDHTAPQRSTLLHSSTAPQKSIVIPKHITLQKSQ